MPHYTVIKNTYSNEDRPQVLGENQQRWVERVHRALRKAADELKQKVKEYAR